jgi:hypothetical protein
MVSLTRDNIDDDDDDDVDDTASLVGVRDFALCIQHIPL